MIQGAQGPYEHYTEIWGGFPKLGVPVLGVPIYIGVPLFWETTLFAQGHVVGVPH